MALGRIAHESTLRALGQRLARRAIRARRAARLLGALALFDSYHCSRYNTNTGVLTTEMFRAVFATVRASSGRLKPGDHLLGALVRRKHRIEHLGDHAVVDHPGHALDQRHAVDHEGRQVERARERQVRVRQDRERQVQPLDRLALVVGRLRRQAEQLRDAEPLQVGEMVAEGSTIAACSRVRPGSRPTRRAVG